MAKRRRKIVKLYTKDDLSAGIWAEYTDAKVNVEFILTLARHFIGISKRGLPWECLLVKAIEAAAREHPSMFPHKCKHAYVIGNTAYIIDRNPTRAYQLHHVVRYHHNFTKTLRNFDSFTKKKFAEEFGDQGIEVRLRPPRGHGAAGPRNAAPSKKDGSRAKVLRGAHRRAVDAGLIAPGAFAA
jgi:hypothetical protein